MSSDNLSIDERSALMRSVRRKDTRPEVLVRQVLHKLGLRFRLHRKDLPGTPDIVLRKHKTVIFVHGCFWHRHQGCSKATTPKSHRDFWLDKFTKNTTRDAEKIRQLESRGWRVLTVWECETRNLATLRSRFIDNFPQSLATCSTRTEPMA